MKPLTECENCSSIWSPGSEEYDWQKCSSCGWSPGQPIDEDEDGGDPYKEIDPQNFIPPSINK